VSRLQQTVLVLGCATLLWLETPRAWNVFAADLGRAIEPLAAVRVERPNASPVPFTFAPLASLPPMLWGLRAGASMAVVADAR